MLRCPNCNEEIIVDYNGDIEAKMFNFFGDSATIEMTVYCDNCEEDCVIVVPAKIELDFDKTKFLIGL